MFLNNNCQNNAYLDPQTCSRCICPDGFSGTNCDQRDTASSCGSIITNPTPNSPIQITIQNPFPTSTTSTQQYCVFLIQVRRIYFGNLVFLYLLVSSLFQQEKFVYDWTQSIPLDARFVVYRQW